MAEAARHAASPPAASALRRAAAVLAAAGFAGSGATAADTAPTLAHCAAIGAAADRLACYDALAGRAPAPPAAPVVGADGATETPSTSQLAPIAAVASAEATPRRTASTSLLSRYWELDAADKRGVFNFVGYKPNYVLPLHLTSRINRAPQSPTQAVVPLPDYRREEAKFQLSLRTKLAQDVLGTGTDVWGTFTQQALWQIWNGKDSKPFRNSDYEPELIVMVPTAPSLRVLPLGWRWRYTQFGIAHQSNGQSDPLSRSWNRVYLGAGVENGDWSLTARLNQRLNEPLATDNNPDIVTYRGRGEFRLNWAHGRQTTSLLYRTTLTGLRYGALQLEWTYPVFDDQPNGLRWFVQAFRGYGETLTDYNFRQTSLGAGVTFLQF